MPYGTSLGFHLQHGIHHLDAIHNDGVVGGTDTIANQFEKTPVDHVFRWKAALLAVRNILDLQRALLRIFGRVRVSHLLRKDANVIPFDSREEATSLVTVQSSICDSRKSAYSSANTADASSPSCPRKNNDAQIRAAIFEASVEGE